MKPTDLEILFEDDNVIVVFKPAGLATQTKKVGEKDLVSLLKNYLKGSYVGVIHRLDQPVSGLLVFAKNQKAAAELSKQVSQKGETGFTKKYEAIVLVNESTELDPDKTTGTKAVTIGSKIVLENYITKTKEGTAKIVADSEKVKYLDAKKALLEYEVESICEYEGVKLAKLDVDLKTGRFHQIRAQLSNAGMPIIGDLKYGSEASCELSKKMGLRQVLLCAKDLSFEHPASREKLEFTAKPFHDIMKKIPEKLR